MNARMRRLNSDYKQVKKDFTSHKNIIVTAIGVDPKNDEEATPEKYHVTYFVKGITLLPDGRVEVLNRHEVEITLHAEYPRYKPICGILTPIWHPNFRDGQICIGDIWGAGESLSDIIINIGHMIQYKSWNSASPLSADAAKWAIENKHLFPVDNINLYVADYASAKDTVNIDLFDESGEKVVEETTPTETAPTETAPIETAPTEVIPAEDFNDFEITAEELAGIEFVPTVDRMQTISHGGTVKGGKINFKTVLVKGLLWAFIGALLGFIVSEVAGIDNAAAAKLMGYSYLSQWYDYKDTSDEALMQAMKEFEAYCDKNGLDASDSDVLSGWLSESASKQAKDAVGVWQEYDEKAEEVLYQAYKYEFGENEYRLEKGITTVSRLQTALWAAVIALFIGLFLGVGEGVFYGSKEKAVKYAAIGAAVALGIGLASGYIAQWMYSEMLTDDPSDIAAAFVRGLGWAIMGLGVGIAVGLIKPEQKRIIFCSLGGLGGGFIGGFLFDYVCEIIPDDVVARGVAIVVMGLLIGIGVGLLEQFAKQAWLKVIRGEFEGKEYLVFAGTTSIGNNGKNTIVLFKDKLVGPHHCDIVLEGSQYVIHDCGTPMGTVVNGRRTVKHSLRQGDTIAIGNSVLVFNTK